MNLKKTTACLFLLASLLTTNIWAKGGIPDYRGYDWEGKATKKPLTEEERKETAIVLKDFKGYQYTYNLKGELVLHTVEHKIIWVNSDNAIEGNNKVYVPLWDVIDIVQLKARAIKKDGTTVELDKSNIKEIENEETGGQYQIFAIEGVEVDSEIEYFYVWEKKATAGLYGDRDFYQYGLPAKNLKFQLISPANLKFIAKSYNGFPQPTEEVGEEERVLTAELGYSEAMKQEEFATYDANKMRIEYKLGFNLAQSEAPLYTWADAASAIGDNVYYIEKDGYKAAKSFAKSLKIKGSAEQKIRKIENELKTNFSIQKGYTAEFYDISNIINNKYGNETGLIRLYAQLFNIAGIEHELVLTTDRSEIRFDGEFASWRYLDNYAFYFPSTKKYLAPGSPELRYGMLPFYWTENQALFVKPIVGKTEEVELETRIGFIPSLTSDESFDNLNIEVVFAENMEKATLSIESKSSGYYAANIQPYFPFIAEDKQKEVAEDLIGRYAEGAEFSSIETKNTEKNISPLEKPFIVKGVCTASSFIESAGPKYLFKLGSLIGPQVEMYQESTRQNQVENDFNRLYDRTIRFTIPDGYQIKNLEDININAQCMNEKGDKSFTFESSYTIKGNKVEVRIVEFYKDIYYPIKNFEPFRKVVNAAADFNKITLVMEPKG